MVGGVDAGGEAAAHAFAAVGVASHLQSQPMRLVDDRLDLLEAERRAVDQRGVGPPHVRGAGEILGGVDLDVVDAVELGLAHGGAGRGTTAS